MNRKEQLIRSREIYDKLQKEGVYNTELIAEGYRMSFPDKEVPATPQARREFFGFHYHFFSDAMKELDNLMNSLDHDSTQNDAPKEDKKKQSHKEKVKITTDKNNPQDNIITVTEDNMDDIKKDFSKKALIEDYIKKAEDDGKRFTAHTLHLQTKIDKKYIKEYLESRED